MINIRFPFRLISKDNNRANCRGRFYLDPKYKKFEKDVQQVARAIYTGTVLEVDLNVLIEAYFTNRVHCDCLNLPKGLCDALQGVVFKNDKQIKKASVKVYENSAKDSFSIIVYPMSCPEK